eukprot:SAG22_NODE_1062_length_5759_cov_11.271025_2_plen_131_part_00
MNITSIAGCPTNRPLPAGSCPHLCDRLSQTCQKVPHGTAGANKTLGDCAKTCKKVSSRRTTGTVSPTCLVLLSSATALTGGGGRCLQQPPSPPPTPLYAEPCIRVANTIPTMNNVDIQIVQTLPAGTGEW